jgi:hypothetical protein
MQKSQVKKYFIFLEIKIYKVLTKIYTIVLLFYYYYLLLENCIFLYCPKYNVFFPGTFLHTLLICISICIFNLIIFGDIKV